MHLSLTKYSGTSPHSILKEAFYFTLDTASHPPVYIPQCPGLVSLPLHSPRVQNAFLLSPQTNLSPRASQAPNSSFPWSTHTPSCLAPATELTPALLQVPALLQGEHSAWWPQATLCPNVLPAPSLHLTLKTIHPLLPSTHLFQNKQHFPPPTLVRLQASQRQ